MILTASSFDLNCFFVNYDGSTAAGYNCRVENDVALDFPNSTIEKIAGNHLSWNNDHDVDRLFFISNPKMFYIPIGYSRFFVHLSNLWIADCPIKSISKTDFENQHNFKIVGMRNTNIEVISEDVFTSMDSLEELHLHNNKIKIIFETAFFALRNLRVLKLSNNKLEYLPRKVLFNNIDLQKIYLNDNNLKIVESEIFSSLQKLERIEFRNNLCMSKNFPDDLQTVTLVNDFIKANCENPMTMIINDLKKSKANNEATTEELRSEIADKDKNLMNQESEIKKISNEKENYLKNVLLLQNENKQLLLEKFKLKQEVEILGLNISDFMIKLDQFVDLEFNITEINRELTECVEIKNNVTAKNKVLSFLEFNYTSVLQDNRKLIDSKLEIERKLKETLQDQEQLKINVKNLTNDHIKLADENDGLTKTVLVLHDLVSNLTETANLQGDESESLLENKAVAFLTTIGLFLIVLVLLVMITRKFYPNKQAVYNTSEMSIVS